MLSGLFLPWVDTVDTCFLQTKANKSRKCSSLHEPHSEISTNFHARSQSRVCFRNPRQKSNCMQEKNEKGNFWAQRLCGALQQTGSCGGLGWAGRGWAALGCWAGLRLVWLGRWTGLRWPLLGWAGRGRLGWSGVPSLTQPSPAKPKNDPQLYSKLFNFEETIQKSHVK